MAIKGSDIYDSLKDKIREVERESEAKEREVFGVERSITSMTEERETVYVKLALKYLPNLEADSVKSTLHEVQAEVQELVKRKQIRRQELDNAIESEKKKMENLEKRLGENTSTLDQLSLSKTEIESKIAKTLSENSSYTELDAKTQSAKERLEQNERRIDEMEELARTKLPAYSNNKIFNYLLERNFGTENYSSTGIISRLDSLAAEFISFESQKKTYDFLRAMPELMQQEIKVRQRDLMELISEMQKVESSTAKEYGIGEVLVSIESSLKTRKDLVAKQEREKETYKDYISQRDELDSSKDPYYQRAVQELKEYLKGESIQELKRRARETPDQEDDYLVQRIEELDSEVRRLKDNAKQKRSEREAVDKKLSGLKDVESTYTRMDYEARRSRFGDEFDLDSLITGYMLGQWDTRHITSEMERHHYLKEEPTYHSSSSYGGYGGSSHRSSSSSSWGSDSSSSSWSSSSSFGSSDSFSSGSFGGSDSFGGGSFGSSDSF